MAFCNEHSSRCQVGGCEQKMSKVDRNLHGDSQVDFAIAIYVAYLILDSLSNEN